MRKIILTDVAWIEPIEFDGNRTESEGAITTIYIDVNHVDVYFGTVDKQFFSAIEEKIKEVCWEEEVIIVNVYDDNDNFVQFLKKHGAVSTDINQIRFTRKHY